MFELIEIELTRIRKLAEQVDDSTLLYFIDMAVLQANAKARLRADSVAALVQADDPQARPIVAAGAEPEERDSLGRRRPARSNAFRSER